MQIPGWFFGFIAAVVTLLLVIAFVSPGKGLTLGPWEIGVPDLAAQSGSEQTLNVNLSCIVELSDRLNREIDFANKQADLAIGTWANEPVRNTTRNEWMHIHVGQVKETLGQIRQRAQEGGCN